MSYAQRMQEIQSCVILGIHCSSTMKTVWQVSTLYVKEHLLGWHLKLNSPRLARNPTYGLLAAFLSK